MPLKSIGSLPVFPDEDKCERFGNLEVGSGVAFASDKASDSLNQVVG